MNGRIIEIRCELEEIAEHEAIRLFRLARRAKKHGCSNQTVTNIRNEAFELHMTGYPERLLAPFKTWRYAFR